ncbi:glycosyltransferase [Paenibacillus jilunlii]|uniref:Glycosyl transferase family 1 domain-containing protein n=1 Tax=Paenibacillus jilunlii TaxID=682956 RepID=A0A1G9S7M8_9BACL|nr:glycosyltransferase [Paenibacillus jilunlii]SDM31307.1 hypothetical protein SAMN05216191_11186 [Paenibacillus jilunlii]
MKNAIYIVYDFESYRNKILGQMSSLRNFGYDTYLLTICENGSCEFSNFTNGEMMTLETFKLQNYSKYTLKPRYELSSYIDRLISKYDFKLFYFRRLGLDITGWSLIFKKIKKNNSREILYEIPTYPFDKVNRIKSIIATFAENFYFQRFIYKYIDRIPVVVQNDCVLDHKMVEFNNAIDISSIKHLYAEPKKIGKEFNVMALAHVNYWHGYDRALRSLAAYKGEKEIYLYIISNETKELNNLRKLSSDLNIEKNVIFKKYRDVEDIQSEVRNYHVALGGLGYYRRNAKYDTSIKNKEYCAFGLPFVIANPDKSFPKDFKYQYKVLEDENIFDFNNVINWFKEISAEDYKKEMIKYACENLIYDLQMVKLLK